MHGGTCTGPKTPEGKLRVRVASYRHGKRTDLAMAVRQHQAAERCKQHQASKIVGRAKTRGLPQQAVAAPLPKPRKPGSSED
jgi:hypothetical protein